MLRETGSACYTWLACLVHRGSIMFVAYVPGLCTNELTLPPCVSQSVYPTMSCGKAQPPVCQHKSQIDLQKNPALNPCMTCCSCRRTQGCHCWRRPSPWKVLRSWRRAMPPTSSPSSGVSTFTSQSGVRAGRGQIQCSHDMADMVSLIAVLFKFQDPEMLLSCSLRPFTSRTAYNIEHCGRGQCRVDVIRH